MALPCATSQIRNSTSTSSLLAKNKTTTFPIQHSKSVISYLTPPAESFISLSSVFKIMTSTSAGLVCTSGSTCRAYNCIACLSRSCFCSINSSGKSTCFQDGLCYIQYSTIPDCSPGEGYIVDSCCSPTGYCISIAKDPSWYADPGDYKCDHRGSWQGIWQGSTSCQAFH